VNAGHCGESVSKLHNGLEMLLSLSRVKIDHMTGRQRVATAVFSQYHQEDGTASLCSVLITTCSILNFVLELNLLYHLQLHMCACVASQWLHMQHSSSTADAMFVCIQM